jgi:hypothetical protein
VGCVMTLSEWKQRAGAKKDFETEHSGVFAAPGSPLAHFFTAEPGLRATLAICLFFRAMGLFAAALDVDPGIHSGFQSAIVGIAIE